MSVVVGYVDRPDGHKALQHASEEARRRQTSLVVVHIAKVGIRQDEGDEILSYREEVEHIAARMREQGVECEARAVMSPARPSEALLEVAKEVAADLIVIGLRGRSAVGKMLMGSVAQDVLLAAPCPVLAVKA